MSAKYNKERQELDPVKEYILYQIQKRIKRDERTIKKAGFSPHRDTIELLINNGIKI